MTCIILLFIYDHPADTRTLVQLASNEAAEFRCRYGYELECDALCYIEKRSLNQISSYYRDAALIATGRALSLKDLVGNILTYKQRGFVHVDESIRVVDAKGSSFASSVMLEIT
ncbi:hypothetical protein CASFOL_039434 [Castilleja foliolosa]|uniref:Uncharacterized protein n=1 Tax=Castilleja foliolosa TaxID=1961234 RepID=A0ABD3BHX9_9LAMI